MLSVCTIPAALFLCGSSRVKGGSGGKESGSSPAQEMADQSEAAASKARTRCQEAPTQDAAYRNAATAPTGGGGGDPGRDRGAGCPLCVPCGGPDDSGVGAVGGDCCCCCCDCGCVDCCDCDGVLDCICLFCCACLIFRSCIVGA